jgi:hypothetical protein
MAIFLVIGGVDDGGASRDLAQMTDRQVRSQSRIQVTLASQFAFAL